MTAEEYSKQKAQEAGCGVEFTTNELADAFNAGMQEMRDRLMKDAAKVSICIPYENRYGGYTQLVDTDRILPIGEHIVIVIKEE